MSDLIYLTAVVTIIVVAALMSLLGISCLVRDAIRFLRDRREN